MWRTCGMAVLAALAAATARAQEAGSACELPEADRARTPPQRCLACHDGSTGPGVFFAMRAGEPGMSHPVEVDYGEAEARDSERYVSRAMLPADVPLVDGKVACTSCHDGASPEPKRVVDPARLCYACHRL